MLKNYPIVISCDWFSYTCSCEGGCVPVVDETYADPASAANFTICEGAERHPFYESAALVRSGNAPVAHIFYRCKRADNRFSCQVKVDNSRLYYAHWGEAVQALIRALHWHIMFVNRIDICADFNYFANGRLPIQFCRDYLSKPTAARPSFIRHSSNKLRAQVTRTLHSLNYETLSWGTRDSAVQVNLYNKSLEITERADKPWIRQRWIEGGLLHGKYDGKRYDVWRVEFSINPAALMILDKKSKNPVGQLNLNHVYTPAALINTWKMLYPRYFSFHYLTKEAHNDPRVRVRDLPLVQLFDPADYVPYEVKGVQYYRKSNKTDRLLLKRLKEQIDEEGLTADQKASLNQVLDMLYALYMMNGQRAARANLTNDVIDDYLIDCFSQVAPIDPAAADTQQKQWRRRARLWTRMLQSSHDADLAQFSDALRQLEELSGTDTFEQCLRFANYVAGGAMPDYVISDMVDEEVLCEADGLPVYPSAPHPD